MKKALLIAAALTIGSSVSGCIPIALGYAAYEFSRSSRHDDDEKTIRMCLQKDAQDTDFCKQLLAERSVQ